MWIGGFRAADRDAVLHVLLLQGYTIFEPLPQHIRCFRFPEAAIIRRVPKSTVRWGFIIYGLPAVQIP